MGGNHSRWVFAVALLACGLPASLSASADDVEPPPVRVTYLSTRDGKPPLKYHSVRLTLTNRHDHPVWFVLPYYGERPLPKEGIFVNKDPSLRPFGGKGYKGMGGPVVEVVMYGGEGFKAIRVPGKGCVELDGYQITAWKAFREISVLEARELKVNGKTPLEKWLPYATLSARKASVDKKALDDWKNLDWDEKTFKQREDYPAEKVGDVRAKKTRLWVLKLQPPSDKEDP